VSKAHKPLNAFFILFPASPSQAMKICMTGNFLMHNSENFAHRMNVKEIST